MHAAAAGALDSLLRNGDMVAIVPQNLAEFWNACTRPSDRNGLGISPSETDKHVSKLEALLTVLPEVPDIYPEWRRLVATHSVSGVRVYDARLVASMNIYKVTDILTFNGPDFSRFPGIRVLDPKVVAPKQEG